MIMTTEDKKELVCVIDRSKWARGGRATQLANTDGTFCCLGLLGAQCGVSHDALLIHGGPNSLWDSERAKYPQNVAEWDPFIKTNDSNKITDNTREKKLRALAKKNGFRFRFTGK
jgi:hypothetical protein